MLFPPQRANDNSSHWELRLWHKSQNLVSTAVKQQKLIPILWHVLLVESRQTNSRSNMVKVESLTCFQSCLYGCLSWSCLPVYYVPDCFHWSVSSTWGKEILRGFISACRAEQKRCSRAVNFPRCILTADWMERIHITPTIRVCVRSRTEHSHVLRGSNVDWPTGRIHCCLVLQ